MKKVKVHYPISVDSDGGSDSYGSGRFIIKTIAASFCGALIPAVIFYFLM